MRCQVKKSFYLYYAFLTLILVSPVWAGWQVEKAVTPVPPPREPFFETGLQPHKARTSSFSPNPYMPPLVYPAHEAHALPIDRYGHPVPLNRSISNPSAVNGMTHVVSSPSPSSSFKPPYSPLVNNYPASSYAKTLPRGAVSERPFAGPRPLSPLPARPFAGPRPLGPLPARPFVGPPPPIPLARSCPRGTTPCILPPPVSYAPFRMPRVSPPPLYAISVSGSLKENLHHILGRHHWKVIWRAPYDYNFDGRITGCSLENVVEKLLRPFPLQAVMYVSNRTVAIMPRNIS